MDCRRRRKGKEEGVLVLMADLWEEGIEKAVNFRLDQKSLVCTEHDGEGNHPSAQIPVKLGM